ncbi:MAG TPA: hypothetical protein VET48_05100, partial [Steroidobacteraceae bacterium]|nr:hypothetical protein [Steroidobacteraceae bacterium]
MRTRADVVDALAGLNVQDRQWIVDRLSPHARRALLDEQSGRSLQAANAQNSRQPDQAPAKPPTDLEVATGSLESAAGESLAEVLCNEPMWITHSLLSYRAWPWRATLLRELPARMRSELSQLDICMTRYSSRLVESLLVGVATQVSNAASRDAAG